MTVKKASPIKRLKVLAALVILALATIAVRLFYWQILSRNKLQALADVQHSSAITIPANRGRILSSDGFPLVTNQAAFLAFAYRPDVEHSAAEIAEKLSVITAPTAEELEATPSAELTTELVEKEKMELLEKLSNQDLSWIPLRKDLTPDEKKAIEALNIPGIGFDEYQVRYYPEASMSAQLLGFVGSDGNGHPKGYFGLEGHYNFELTGKPGLIKQETDALGSPIVFGDFTNVAGRNGRDLKTHIDRGMQLLVERKLRKGMERYQASQAEVIIMDPKTGAVTSLFALPSFDPRNYKKYDSNTYKVPTVSDSYEPGSTFKVITMAAAVNEGVVTKDTRCDSTCDGPVTIGKYTIRTWNNEYNPGQTMTEVLERSDNTGMIFVANKLGKDMFTQYIKSFGFGENTNIDLEGEASPKLRQRWGDIDLATGSFGQGLAVTSIQMVRAVAAIANDGKLMEPQVVDSVLAEGEEVEVKPRVTRQVISKEAADEVTQMMVRSAEHGDAQWAIPEGFEIAGKTGTAQIPIAGHYDAEKTVASFVGFAPANDPQFVMLVKLREPQTSPWASETAAPLWFDIAKDLYTYLSINAL